MKLDSEVKEIFANVNHWLSFAEAKNGLVVGINGALLIGLTQVLTGDEFTAISWPLQYYCYHSLLLSALGAIVALVALIPKTSLPWNRATGLPNPSSDNLLFFEHIGRYRGDEYLKTLCERLKTDHSQQSPLAKLYSDQLVVNAKIASRKMRLFRLAAWMTVAAVVTVPLGLLFAIFVESDK